MCHDVTFTTSYELLTDYLPNIEVDPQVRIAFENNLQDGYAIAQAHGKAPVILFEDGKYKAKLFEWGVIAPYMNTPEKIKALRKSMVNARSEKIVEDRKSFWHRIRKQRCLYPVRGIYEHREIKGWKNKVPYYIRLKGRSMYGIPALYHYPEKGDVETGEIFGTFSLITRPANDVMKLIHNSGENAFRMPLFLPKELEIKWLSPELTDSEIQEILSFEMPSEELEYCPVFTVRTNKERPDKKGRTDPYVWENLPPLGVDESNLQLF